MKKALLTSNNTSIKQANKRKYIKGGAAKYNFNINENTNSDNIIKIIATNTNDKKKTNITYFTKSTKSRELIFDDIKEFKNNDDKLFNIITANLTETNYYQGNITDYEDFLNNIKSFDTCIFVKLSNNNIYVFLKVEKKSSNIALKTFDTYQTNKDNISQIDATMIKNFKSLGLDINFVNKFVAGVKGYIDGQKKEIKIIIEKQKAEAEPKTKTEPKTEPKTETEAVAEQKAQAKAQAEDYEDNYNKLFNSSSADKVKFENQQSKILKEFEIQKAYAANAESFNYFAFYNAYDTLALSLQKYLIEEGKIIEKNVIPISHNNIKFKYIYEQQLQQNLKQQAEIDNKDNELRGGKKINTNKILNNLILKLSKINNVKKPTKPKVTKPKAVKPTKPKVVKPTKPKAVKPTKPKAVKPTKPKAVKPTKPKATKPKAVKPTKPKTKVTKPKAIKKI